MPKTKVHAYKYCHQSTVAQSWPYTRERLNLPFWPREGGVGAFCAGCATRAGVAGALPLAGGAGAIGAAGALPLATALAVAAGAADEAATAATDEAATAAADEAAGGAAAAAPLSVSVNYQGELVFMYLHSVNRQHSRKQRRRENRVEQ